VSVPSPVRPVPLVELRCPTEFFFHRASSRIGFGSSLLALLRSPAGLPGFRPMECPSQPKPSRTSSLELAVSFRVLRSPSGHTLRSRPKPFASCATSSLAVSSPSAFSPPEAAAHDDQASHAQPACASRFSQPHDAFVSAPSLPALFHAGSAPGVRPSEPCSSRAAVRRLRRRCPLVVRSLPPTAVAKSLPCVLAETETPEQQLLSGGLLQTPSPSGLCSTRKSATSLRLFRPPGARSSPGIHPLQGFLPHRNGTTFIAPPLMRLSSVAIARFLGLPFRVFLRGGIGSSRKRDRLPS
jgi:hypothetical protein